MLDHAPPTPEALEEATGFISAQLKDGRSVLVHCLAGIGRTGSVLAAYMIEYEGKTADDAIARLRVIRPGSVEGPRRLPSVSTSRGSDERRDSGIQEPDTEKDQDSSRRIHKDGVDPLVPCEPSS